MCILDSDLNFQNGSLKDIEKQLENIEFQLGFMEVTLKKALNTTTYNELAIEEVKSNINELLEKREFMYKRKIEIIIRSELEQKHQNVELYKTETIKNTQNSSFGDSESVKLGILSSQILSPINTDGTTEEAIEKLAEKIANLVFEKIIYKFELPEKLKAAQEEERNKFSEKIKERYRKEIQGYIEQEEIIKQTSFKSEKYYEEVKKLRELVTNHSKQEKEMNSKK